MLLLMKYTKNAVTNILVTYKYIQHNLHSKNQLNDTSDDK